MKSIYRYLAILAPLLSMVRAGAAELNYIRTALTPVSFASFDKDYLGDGHHFTPERLSPMDLSMDLDRFKHTLQTSMGDCSFLSCIAMDLIEALLPDGMSRADVLKQLDARRLSTFTQGAWGIAVANADNDPDGPDNLFVVVDDVAFHVNVLDFLHPNIITPSGKEREILDLLNINLSNVRLPSFSSSGFNDKGLEMKEGLSNPRGICTNRSGDFWVADMGKNRVVHYRYDSAKRKLNYLGSLYNLNQPMDVAYSPAAGGYNELLGIANTNGNSLVFVSPDIRGEVDYRTLSDFRKGEMSYLNSVHLVRPTAIAADLGNPERVYIAQAGRKLARLERSGPYAFRTVNEALWPIEGEISSLKCDRDGNLFVVDMLSSFIGKFTPQFDFIFSSGGYSDGSDLATRGTRTGFNFPKYIAIGNQDDMFVSERWVGYSGLQRFFNWPRLVDQTASFQLDCRTSDPIGNRSVEFKFNVTKTADVAIELFKVPASGPQVSLWSQTFKGRSAGPNSIVVPVSQLGSKFQSDATYRAQFIVYETGPLASESDRTTYWVDLGDPSVVANTAAIATEYFNPALFPATAEFNISRESQVSFKMAPKDATGDPNSLPFISLGASRDLPRLETGVHTVQLNIAPSDLAKVQEMKAMTLWIEMTSLPCGTKVLTPFPVADGKSLFLDRTAPTGAFQALSTKGFNPSSRDFASMSFSFSAADNSLNKMQVGFGVYNTTDLENPVRRLNFNSTYLEGQPPLSFFWDGKNDDGAVAPSGDYLFSAFVQDLAGNASRVNSGSFILDTDSPVLSFSLPGAGVEYEPFNSNWSGSAGGREVDPLARKRLAMYL